MRKPADMHQHLRQGGLLKTVAPMVAKRFASAIIMPNTLPPVTTPEALNRYRDEIADAAGPNFQPLMTYYLTDTLDARVVENSVAYGVKYYPAGLTTNSESGVKSAASLWTPGTSSFDVLRVLTQLNKVLLLHAADGFDKNGNELDPYDQERHFIAETLPRIIDAHPNLRISVEHLSTIEGVEFLRCNGGEGIGCSLTAQHLLLDRRDVFRGGFRPHRFWWPIIQPKEHKDELRKFAGEGHAFVWLGSDSAPHPRRKKETDCCSGGVLTAHAGIELYVEAFEEIGVLDKLEDFASFHGPNFFSVKLSTEQIQLEQKSWTVPERLMSVECSDVDSAQIVPFRSGEMIRWKLTE